MITFVFGMFKASGYPQIFRLSGYETQKHWDAAVERLGLGASHFSPIRVMGGQRLDWRFWAIVEVRTVDGRGGGVGRSRNVETLARQLGDGNTLITTLIAMAVYVKSLGVQDRIPPKAIFDTSWACRPVVQWWYSSCTRTIRRSSPYRITFDHMCTAASNVFVLVSATLGVFMAFGMIRLTWAQKLCWPIRSRPGCHFR